MEGNGVRRGGGFDAEADLPTVVETGVEAAISRITAAGASLNEI